VCGGGGGGGGGSNLEPNEYEGCFLFVGFTSGLYEPAPAHRKRIDENGPTRRRAHRLTWASLFFLKASSPLSKRKPEITARPVYYSTKPLYRDKKHKLPGLVFSIVPSESGFNVVSAWPGTPISLVHCRLKELSKTRKRGR